MCSDVIQNELAVIESGASGDEASASVTRIRQAFRDKIRSATGRRGIRRDLLSVTKVLGARETVPAPTRRSLAYSLVEVLQPLAALESPPGAYEFARQEEYLIGRMTDLLSAKMQLVRGYFTGETDRPSAQLPVRASYLLSEAADLMIGHAVRAIFQYTMRNKFMITAVYTNLDLFDADDEGAEHDPFAAVAKQLMPRFRQNATEVAVAWRKVGQRDGWADATDADGNDDAERAAIAAVKAMRVEAEIFDVFLPERVDLNLIAQLTQISSTGLEEALRDIAGSINHQEGEPYLRRMIERIVTRGVPLEGDLVMLAALHLPERGARLPIRAANGSCIGSCRSREEMLSVRGILAGELQRLPAECLDRLNAHKAGEDRLSQESLDVLIEKTLELVIGLSRARFQPEVTLLEKGLAALDKSGRLASWLKGEKHPSDIEGMRIVLAEAL